MNIRKAVSSDASGIAEVHVKSWQETYQGIVNQDYLDRLKVEERLQIWNQALANPKDNAPIFVAENHNGEVIGFASFGPERTEADIDGELYAIYILKEYLGMGIGKQLVQKGINEMKQHGYNSMLVWVLANNPSRHFYESLGGEKFSELEFQLAGERQVEVSYIWKDINQFKG